MKLTQLNKKGVDWSNPQTLVVVVLAIILGLTFLYLVWNLRGRLMP